MPPPAGLTATIATVVRTTASSQNSGAAIAIIAVVCVLALGLLAWEAARWWGYEPAWALRLRHAFAEAGLRCAETWSELLDWARGR